MANSTDGKQSSATDYARPLAPKHASETDLGTKAGCEMAAGATGSAATETHSSAAPTPGAASTLKADRDALEFYFAVGVHYHRARQGWLTDLHRWAMFGSIGFGAASVAQLAPVLTGVAVALIGAADLAFNFVERSAKHADLARDYLMLAQKLANAKSEADLEGVRDRWLETSGAEPARFHVVDDMAHNAAIRSLGRDDSQIISIPRYRRRLAHLWRFENL